MVLKRHEHYQERPSCRQDGRTTCVETTKKKAEFRTKIVEKGGGFSCADAAVEVELAACTSKSAEEEEEGTVTTAPITTDCSSSWSLYTQPSEPLAGGGCVDSGCSPVGGPFVPSWPVVENIVGELCSPVYSVRKGQSGSWGGKLALLSSLDQDENTPFPHSPSASTGGEEPILDGGDCADPLLQENFHGSDIERCDPQQSAGECLVFPPQCDDTHMDNNDFTAIDDKRDGNDSKDDAKSVQDSPSDQQMSLFMLTPRPPIPRLFGEMLCRVYLNNAAADLADSLRLTPISIQSSFIFFAHERSLLIAHNWGSKTIQFPMLSSPKTDVCIGRKRITDGKEPEPQTQFDKNVVAQCDDIIPTATNDDTQTRDDIPSVSSGFWGISESAVMTPASRSNVSTTIFVNTASGALVEEGASMFEDEELRAFMLMAQDGDDASKVFPTFSQDSNQRECESDEDTDDGLSDELVALDSIEHDLRAELENADQVIKGVLFRQEKTKIARQCSNVSISPLTTTELIRTDDSSLPLSVETSSFDREPSAGPEMSISLRKVRFSQKNQEYIFFSEEDEGQESFHDFIFGMCEEIHASFGDFLDEIACRPIPSSLTSTKSISSRGR